MVDRYARGLSVGIQSAMHRGIGTVPEPEPEPEATPITILGADLLQWCRSDLGVQLSDSNVDAWLDQSGNGNDYAQTGSARPTYTAVDATLGGRPSINFARASSQFLAAPSFTRPAPGTEPTWLCAVIKYRTWTNNGALFSADSGLVMMVRMGPTDPNIRLVNATNGVANPGLPINTWGRCEAYFSNSVADYLMLIGNIEDGANAGNTAGTGRRIGGHTTFVDMDIAEIIVSKAKPSAGQLAELEDYLGTL